MDFNYKKDLELLCVTWEEDLDLTGDRSEWRNYCPMCYYSTWKD